MVDISFETRTVEREYVVFDGGEYLVSRVLDLLNELSGTDGFVSGVRCTGLDDEIASELVSVGVLSHSHSAGYFVSDEAAFEEFREELRSRFRCNE